MDRKAGKVSQVFPSCHPVSLQCCLLYWISLLSRGMARIAIHLGEGWNGLGLLSTVLERWEGSESPVGFLSRQLETVSASSVLITKEPGSSLPRVTGLASEGVQCGRRWYTGPQPGCTAHQEQRLGSGGEVGAAGASIFSWCPECYCLSIEGCG